MWKLLSIIRPQIEKMWSFGTTHSAVGILWAIRISDMQVQYNFFFFHHFLSLLSQSIPLFSPFLFSTGTPVHAELMNAVIMNLYCCVGDMFGYHCSEGVQVTWQLHVLLLLQCPWLFTPQERYSSSDLCMSHFAWTRVAVFKHNKS